MTLKNQIKETVVLSLLLMLGVWGAATLAAPGSDVVVKKNADGTVDVSDATAESAPPAAQSGTPGVHYRLKNFVGTRRINGVNVRTNPDGSIETLDEESAPVRVHRATTTAKKRTTVAKKHK